MKAIVEAVTSPLGTQIPQAVGAGRSLAAPCAHTVQFTKILRGEVFAYSWGFFAYS